MYLNFLFFFFLVNNFCSSNIAPNFVNFLTRGKIKLLVNLQEARLLTLIEGVLAANIFDWGSRACVDLYHKGTIIEIYRMSRNKMQRPWRVTKPDFRSWCGEKHRLCFNC